MLLVTGASGHSGGWFMKKLAEVNYPGPIRCTMRRISERANPSLPNLNLELFEADLDDPAAALAALKSVTTVVHFAGIQVSKNIVVAAQTLKTDWLILVHTTGRYSKFKSAAQHYIEIEDGILNAGVNCSILRPTMIYGSQKDHNMWRLVDFLHRHKFFPVFGKGNNLMQPVHAKDVGESAYAVMCHREETLNRAYNIAGRDRLTYNQILTVVSEALGKKRYLVHIPYSVSYLAAKIYNWFDKNALISVEQVMRMNEDKAFDYSEAQRDFGYRPLSFAEGIRVEVQEYLAARGALRPAGALLAAQAGD